MWCRQARQVKGVFVLGVIVGMAGFAARRAVLMVVVFVLLAGLGLGYAAKHLSIDTDTNDLFAKNLPWRQAQAAEDKNFPQFDKLIVAVVRGRTPEEARETAMALNAALEADKTDFFDSRYPGGNDYRGAAVFGGAGGGPVLARAVHRDWVDRRRGGAGAGRSDAL
jgi:uncharacterized membrane protein (Fun14 family)